MSLDPYWSMVSSLHVPTLTMTGNLDGGIIHDNISPYSNNWGSSYIGLRSRSENSWCDSNRLHSYLGNVHVHGCFVGEWLKSLVNWSRVESD